MTLSISDPQNLLDEASRGLTERRFLFALARYDSRISEAEISFSKSTSGSKSATQCDVAVVLRHASDVVLTETNAEMTKCISRASERTSRAIGRSIDKAFYLHRNRSIAMNAGAFS